MIIPDKPEDDSILNNLSSHLSGELPNVDFNLQKASEVTTSEVASENQNQSEPNPEQSSTTILEKPSSEPNVPEHSVPEQTGSDHIPSPTLSENAMESDGIILSKDPNEETEQSSPIEVEQSASDQPSFSNTQSSPSINQSSNNLQIEPFAAPKPRKLPSQPTKFLDSNVLRGVCEDITEKMIKLISFRNDLSHRESYDKQWRRLKERVENVMNALSSTCIEAQEQAKQKLQEWH